MAVTTTSIRQGKFETRFWHKIFEEEVGRVKGHFGPINTLVLTVLDRTFCTTNVINCNGMAGSLCIPVGNLTHLEEKMVSFGCTTSTIVTSVHDPMGK